MALPQRRDPDEERRIREMERRRVETESAATTGGFGWWWLWLLIIIAIIWFAGWGWGGYGGWWWGRRATAPAYGTANGAGVPGTANRNGAAAVLPSGQGVAILNATNKRPFVGQDVDIRNVRVQKKIKDRALWIGDNNAGNNPANPNMANNSATANTGANGAGGTANAGQNGAASSTGETGANGATNSANAAEIPTLVVLTGAANGGNNGAGNTAAKNSGSNETPSNAVNGNLNNIHEGQLVNVVGTVEKAPAANVAEKQWGLDHDAATRLEKDGAYIRAREVSTAPSAQPQQ